ncbi:Hypothetical protein [Corynebacterium glutamicum ATCC 13032]|uniref:Uncharacterized protein n=1 Tax=Corynebacterium glutamicum (strain ATCC 13032 / DSM 20300 / JCM 1318 / BCRC 11384 / CCUG 27702 / LMG 3730 / NBRC 12168 / NCIMB 10025 / NRRL B-2784 / 534) TaxID=196627 RepID=Q8NTA8_CORGL|nr:Hypothetical protein [Corynebacterium glutamicum ATCC 13032]CAF19115.1 hypothetical protein predicted by Glimmer/Critica [Corynebacterium glutamicum ATCC 13032]
MDLWWIFASSLSETARIHHRFEFSFETWLILALESFRNHISPTGYKVETPQNRFWGVN